MPVTAQSYAAIALQNAVNMLANSAQFRAVVGAADATEAKSKIIETWGGTPGLVGGAGRACASDGTAFTASPPFAVVSVAPLESELVGVNTYDRSGSVAISLYLRKKLPAETAADSARRALNNIGIISAEIEAQFGSAGAFATGTVSHEGPKITEDGSAEGTAMLGEISVSWFA